MRSGRLARRGFLVLIALWLATIAQLEAGHAAGLTVASSKLTVYRACTLSGTTAASTTTADSDVKQTAPTTNTGAATTMAVSTRLTVNQRSHVQFDLTKCSPVIPSGATVWNATLRLWVTAVAIACETEDIFPVTVSWAETTITWNNQPFGTTLNNPASGSRTDAVNVGAAPCTYSTAAQYVSWNVTPDVASFVAGTRTNYGWMIRDDVEGISGTARTNTFTTSEANSVPQAPQLVVSYST